MFYLLHCPGWMFLLSPGYTTVTILGKKKIQVNSPACCRTRFLWKTEPVFLNTKRNSWNSAFQAIYSSGSTATCAFGGTGTLPCDATRAAPAHSTFQSENENSKQFRSSPQLHREGKTNPKLSHLELCSDHCDPPLAVTTGLRAISLIIH